MQLINNNVLYIIYVIQLEKHKVYVFKTRDFNITKHNVLYSHELHENNWIKMYKPIEVIDAFYTHDENADNIEVKEYMKLHGVSNVRGGIFQAIKIEDTELMAPLIEELTKPFNPCVLCGKTTHLPACCPAFTKYNDYDEMWKLWLKDYENWKIACEQKWNSYYNELQQWMQRHERFQVEQYEWVNKMQQWVYQQHQQYMQPAQPQQPIHNSQQQHANAYYGNLNRKYKKY